MTEAKRTIPHFRLVADFEVDALMQLRDEVRASMVEERISLNDLLIKACALALMDAPSVNVQWAENEIHQFHTADISVVMAIEGGLSTPIIRGAESKTLVSISREVKDLAARAAKNALKMDEILGGSFSVSNLGMYGVDQFDAIINPPQCAILAIGAAKPCFLATKERTARFATLIRVTLSVDHRAIDGATGAAFLAALRHHVEEPKHLCVTKQT
jgi:pyruvate dehydrogenase E2 component (dihydrolipoamide acetyltransferase)